MRKCEVNNLKTRMATCKNGIKMRELFVLQIVQCNGNKQNFEYEMPVKCEMINE